MRRLSLEIAKEKVDAAIRRGDHQLTVLDADSLDLANDGREDHPRWPPLRP
jgi:hypothetical protein